MAQMDAFAFETAEEVLGNSVVIGIASAGHTLPDTEFGKALPVSTGGILYAAIRVEDEARIGLASVDGRVESGESKVGVDMIGEGVADDLLCAKVFHNGAIEPAFVGRDVGDIADPGFVGSVKRKLAHEQIRSDGMRVPGIRSRLVIAFAYGGNTQFIHQTVDALARAGKFRTNQVIQAVQPQCRIALMQAQQPAFERLILLPAQGGLAAQPFVVPAAGDFK